MYLSPVSVAIGVAIAVACALYSRRLAVEKGRNALLWSVLGFVLTVVAVPVLVLLPSAAEARGSATDGGGAGDTVTGEDGGTAGGGTADGIARQVYRDIDPRLLAAAARNVLATLLGLLAEGRVDCPGPLSAEAEFRPA